MEGARGESLAHLVIYRPQPLSFEEEDFFKRFALRSARAVENASHHEETIEWERVSNHRQRMLECKRFHL